MKKNRKVIVKTVRRMPPSKGAAPGMKGNICINEDRKFDAEGKLLSDNSIYLSQRDYRNSLLALDLNSDIACTKLIGATISYDEHTVTPEELTAAGGALDDTSNGRPLQWKTPGLKQTNHRVIAMANFALTETDEINQRMNETTLKRLREQQGMTQAPTRPRLEEPIEDAEVINTEAPATETVAEPVDNIPATEGTAVDTDAEELVN